MREAIKILGVTTLCGILTACATPGVKEVVCVAAGTLVGGAAARYGTDDSDAATAAAAVVGGAIGLALCKEDPPPPPPPPPPPKPKPAPKPMPKPDPDSDGDGVRDSLDECPNTTAGTPVDAKGCPEIPNLKGVHFEFDKAVLTPQASAIMDRAAETLSSNPHVRVEIVGHTDSIGSDQYNIKLSENRAASVRDYLVSRGISASRIATSGLGESAPIATNSTREGRQENRRVELTARPME